MHGGSFSLLAIAQRTLILKSIYELLFHGAGGQRQICPGDHAPKETAPNHIGPKDVGKIGFPTKDLRSVGQDR